MPEIDDAIAAARAKLDQDRVSLRDAIKADPDTFAAISRFLYLPPKKIVRKLRDAPDDVTLLIARLARTMLVSVTLDEDDPLYSEDGK